MPKKKTSKKQEFCFEDMPNLGTNKKDKGTKVQSSKAFKNKLILLIAFQRSFVKLLSQIFLSKEEMKVMAWLNWYYRVSIYII